ncbi:MAG TPA: hypothetical protein VK085_00635 [Pseudogracilibacillus sp.]|nr:hypothetical protein [Pseudogracilibacillus sp.]
MSKNKNTIIVLAVLVIILIGLISWDQYTKSNTEQVYGKIPNETVPDDYDKIEYTIPVIDEEGNRGTQTFTVNNDDEVGHIVKLHILKDKVKKYEFITESQLPEKVKNNL